MKIFFSLLAILLGPLALAQQPATCPTGCLCTCPTITKIKWHPGHYMWLDRNNSTPEIRAGHMKQIDAIASEPVRGVKLSLYWSHLESTPGDYSAGFKIIDEYLARLKARNKYLILSIQDRQFGGYGSDLTYFFPAYVVKDPKYGVTKMSNGITTRVWQPATSDRLIELSRALAARYDSHPNFEMYQVEETSVAVPKGMDGFSVDAHGVQIRRLLDASRKAWTHTLVRLPANFFGSDAQMAGLLSYCRILGVALGGPDIIPSQTIQADRLYIDQYRGIIPWVAEVQSPSLGGSKGTFTPKQLYDNGMLRKPSHFIWYRNTWSGGTAQKWETGLLPFIRSVKGVTNAVCPAALNDSCAQ